MPLRAKLSTTKTTKARKPSITMAARTDFVEVVLTCGSWQEAHKIADHLLHKSLVACVEFLEIQSKYRWHSALDEAKEVKLIMETVAQHFDKIEKEVAKLHGYDTFVLQQIPLTNLSKKAQIWLAEEVKN